LDFHSLPKAHTFIFRASFHQKDINSIKTDKHEQRCVMKFFFPQEKKYKAIYRELRRVLGEAAVCLATVQRWCQRSEVGNFRLMRQTVQDDC
jgi:hypothetical protein